MFEMLAEEAAVDGFYYNLHRLSTVNDSPKADVVVQKLKQKGFQGSRTHFDSLCIRTNATVAELKRIINE
jgi:tRNA G26 N,N-dimethylase Trm1